MGLVPHWVLPLAVDDGASLGALNGCALRSLDGCVLGSDDGKLLGLLTTTHSVAIRSAYILVYNLQN